MSVLVLGVIWHLFLTFRSYQTYEEEILQMVVSDKNITCIPIIMQLCYSYAIMNGMDVCLINNHLFINLPHFPFMSFIYFYTTAKIAWLLQQHNKMLEQSCITDNEVCIVYHS